MKNNLLYTPKDVFAVARDEPEIDNFLNNDIYKFLMQDFVLEHGKYNNLEVEWGMTIRTPEIRTADVIPKAALTEQLEACRSIKGVKPADISYMRGMLGPTGEKLFQEETLKYLENFQLPEYEIGVDEDGGNYTLKFAGKWQDSMMWEIYGLKIVNSLYNFHYIKKSKITDIEFTQIMNTTLGRLFDDISIFKGCPDLQFSEFGTRRSLSTDYQRLVNQILEEQLPEQYMGTSNVMIAREMGGNNPIGTNAHELRMIPTALYDEPQDIINEMYDIDRKWQAHHEGLGILLPDTYGTSFYYSHVTKDILDGHTGARFDSKNPMIAIPEYIAMLQERGIDPMDKIGIPSDGLNAQKATDIQNRHRGDIGKLSYGIGTHLTNNTKGTFPRAEEFGPFGAFSSVIKPIRVKRPDGTWVSTVKLSDNPNKAIGEKERVELFKNIFGNEGVNEEAVLV